MKKKYKLFIILLTFSNICFSQTKYDDFDRLIRKADSLKSSTNYKIALKKYTEALKILTPSSSTPYFDAAFCALKINNQKIAKKWIHKGISDGGAPLHYLKEYEGFKDIQKKPFYLKTLENYNSLLQLYFSKIKNIDIYLEIEELVQRDQFSRKLNDYLTGRSEKDIENAFNSLKEAEKTKDSIAIKKYRELLFPKTKKEHQIIFNDLVVKIDSLNIERLIEITKEHGWQERAWLILWHQRGNHDEDNYVWNYFRPLINKEIEDGKISRDFWKPFDEFKKGLKPH